MMHGIINVPVTDLRAAEDAKSERLTQALFGTPVEIRDIQDGFAKAILPDGYAGWCRLGHIFQVGFSRWEKYRADVNGRVDDEIVEIRDRSGKVCFPFRLYFGTDLVIVRRDEVLEFELPDGSRAPIGDERLLWLEKKRTQGITGDILVDTARRFLGAPYLWGGITPLGFDCSGLVQSVYRRHGIDLPRDSKDQQKVGFEVPLDGLKPGDLLFFPGHVAISCGAREIIHAAASRGMVVEESLDPVRDDFREDLARDFLFVRRLSL
jgi:hypothetical protein